MFIWSCFHLKVDEEVNMVQFKGYGVGQLIVNQTKKKIKNFIFQHHDEDSYYGCNRL